MWDLNSFFSSFSSSRSFSNSFSDLLICKSRQQPFKIASNVAAISVLHSLARYIRGSGWLLFNGHHNDDNIDEGVLLLVSRCLFLLVMDKKW